MFTPDPVLSDPGTTYTLSSNNLCSNKDEESNNKHCPMAAGTNQSPSASLPSMNLESVNKMISGMQQQSSTVYNDERIKREIADSQAILIVYKQKVYNVTKFMKVHPGGSLPLIYQNGKQSTDFIDAFHPRTDIDKRIKPYYVGEYVQCFDSVDDTDSAISTLSPSQSAANSDRGSGVESDASDVPLDDDTAAAAALSRKDQRDSAYHSELASPVGTPVVELLGSILARSSQQARDIQFAEAYVELHQRLKREGFYKPSYAFYVRRIALFFCSLSMAFAVAYFYPSSAPHLVLSALLFGFTWHGLSFTVHDAGHHSVTGEKKIDDLFGSVLASFCGGLSMQWWMCNHNVHHIVTNDPEHDPDIQHLPVFAVCTKLFNSLYSSFYERVMEFDVVARTLVSMQHYLYYPIMTFGRFNLYANSLSFLLNFKTNDGRKLRWLELCGMAFFWTWFGYFLVGHIQGWGLRLMFLYLSHAFTAILHVQITLSHFAMSTEPEHENEHFAVKAARTTMNVDCEEWMDWFHGGLQFQIEHHMFPRIPRCHFRKLAPLVRQFCIEQNLPYQIDHFYGSNLTVLSSLKSVADQVGQYAQSASSSLPTGDHKDSINGLKSD
ncbi:hypothetical protein MP228_013132 [Amoeboaphelidium protococcarum]|nr:hypothetical protein MP228_013132 [Amoeboaphelidium protococcarum]